MSAKLCMIFAIICMLSIQTFGFAINQRLKRFSDFEDKDDDNHDDDKDGLLSGIKLGSQQDSQSTSEHVGKGKSKALQQHHLGQQQLAAAIGGKHYLLQQQTSLGQQMAKLGKKTAIQQLADAQKQAVANGKVNKSSKVHAKDKTEDAIDDDAD